MRIFWDGEFLNGGWLECFVLCIIKCVLVLQNDFKSFLVVESFNY